MNTSNNKERTIIEHDLKDFKIAIINLCIKVNINNPLDRNNYSYIDFKRLLLALLPSIVLQHHLKCFAPCAKNNLMRWNSFLSQLQSNVAEQGRFFQLSIIYRLINIDNEPF